MKIVEKMQRLKKSILEITDMPENILAAISYRFKEEKFKKNEVAEVEGTICKKLYFIEKGVARLFYQRDGKDITGWFSTDGDFITSNDSFFQRKPSHLNLEFLEDALVQTIHIDELEDLFKKYPEMERFGRLLTYQLLTTLSERMYSMLFQPAEKRYQLLMVHYPEVLMRAPLGDIASFLGISQETLSRIRAQKTSPKKAYT